MTKPSDYSNEIYKITGPNSMATAAQATTEDAMTCITHTNDGTGTCDTCGLDLINATAQAWDALTEAEKNQLRDEAMREATGGIRGWF